MLNCLVDTNCEEKTANTATEPKPRETTTQNEHISVVFIIILSPLPVSTSLNMPSTSLNMPSTSLNMPSTALIMPSTSLNMPSHHHHLEILPIKSNSKSIIPECDLKIDIGPQSVHHVCDEGPLVGSAKNCQDLKCLSIILHMDFHKNLSENRD